jgi:hypothetical protein
MINHQLPGLADASNQCSVINRFFKKKESNNTCEKDFKNNTGIKNHM